MASINAGVERQPEGMSENEQRPLPCLYLRVVLLQLHSEEPSRKPPKLIRSATCRLNCSVSRPFSANVPFSFTWTASYLYATISSASLEVFRVALETTADETAGSGGADQSVNVATGRKEMKPKLSVQVPGETILLPRSSRNRSVQFLPPKLPGTDARVIIGPRHGGDPAPPVVMCFRETDLGTWVDMRDVKYDSDAQNWKTSLDSMIEKPWDEDEDCVLDDFTGHQVAP